MMNMKEGGAVAVFLFRLLLLFYCEPSTVYKIQIDRLAHRDQTFQLHCATMFIHTIRDFGIQD
jgi:hypothetical protein